MNFLDKWLYAKIKDMWSNSHKYNSIYVEETKMATGQAIGIDLGPRQGEDVISFELSSAVGGRILNVSRYNDKIDRHERQTYVIASGEDVGARVTKIVNLELLK
jgi:hypothetical protein